MSKKKHKKKRNSYDGYNIKYMRKLAEGFSIFNDELLGYTIIPEELMSSKKTFEQGKTTVRELCEKLADGDTSVFRCDFNDIMDEDELI